MARNLDSSLLAQMRSGKWAPILLIQIDFASGSTYWWTGLGTITWNGHDWLGTGTLGKISTVSEVNEIRADTVTLSLSAIPSDIVDDVLNEIRQGKACKIWLAAIDVATRALIGNPYQTFGGRVDVGAIEDGEDVCTATITVENRLIDLQRARAIRYTHEDQQAVLAGDLGFEFVPQLQEWNGVWGKGTPVGGGGGIGVGGGSGDDHGHGGLVEL